MDGKPTPSENPISTSVPEITPTPFKESPTPTRVPEVMPTTETTKKPIEIPVIQPDSISSNRPTPRPNTVWDTNQAQQANESVSLLKEDYLSQKKVEGEMQLDTQRKYNFKAVVIRQLKSPFKRKIFLKWKRNKLFTGYQVHFSERNDFKRKTFERFFGRKRTQINILGLKSKKVFYFRIRGYKRVGNKKYYGKWSVVKKVRVM